MPMRGMSEGRVPLQPVRALGGTLFPKHSFPHPLPQVALLRLGEGVHMVPSTPMSYGPWCKAILTHIT